MKTSRRVQCISGGSLALLFVACLNDAPGDAGRLQNPPADTTLVVDTLVVDTGLPGADTTRGDTTGAVDTTQADPGDSTGSDPGPIQLPPDWRSAAGAAAGRYVRSVSRGDSLFVAVGDSGAIVTSRDGVTWTLEVSGTDARLDTVLGGAGGSPYLAVSQNKPWLASLDGRTWQGIGRFTSTWEYRFLGVAWNGKHFVVISTSQYPVSPVPENIIHVSENGINWTQGIPPSWSVPALAMIRGDTATGLFTLWNSEDARFSSANGMTWTPAP